MIISVTIDGYMTLRLFRITFGLIELKGFDEPTNSVASVSFS